MDENRTRKERTETNYRDTRSKDGTLSPIIGASTAARIRRHCARMNINKTKFIEGVLNKALDDLEEQYYQSLSKEELIELVKSGR